MFLLQLNILKRKVKKKIILHSPAHTFPSMPQTEPVVSHGDRKRTTSTKTQKMRAHRQQHSEEVNSPPPPSLLQRRCPCMPRSCSRLWLPALCHANLTSCKSLAAAGGWGGRGEGVGWGGWRRCGWGGWTNRSGGGEGRRGKTPERGESDRKRLGRMESAVIRQVLLRFNSNASLGYIDAGYLDSSLSSRPLPSPPLLLSASPSL